MFALKKQQLKEYMKNSITYIYFSKIADIFDIDLIDIIRSKPIMNIVEKDNILEKKWMVDNDNEPAFKYLIEHDQIFVLRHLRNMIAKYYISFDIPRIYEIFAKRIIKMKDSDGVLEMFSDPSLPVVERYYILIEAYEIMADEDELKHISSFKWFCMKIIHTILPNVSMDEIHYSFYHCFYPGRYYTDCIMSPTLAKRLGEIFGCDVNVHLFEKDFDPNIPLRSAAPKHGYIDDLRFSIKNIFYDNLILLLLTRDDQEAAVTEYMQRNTDVINTLLFDNYSQVFPHNIISIIEQFIDNHISPSITGLEH